MKRDEEEFKVKELESIELKYEYERNMFLQEIAALKDKLSYYASKHEQQNAELELKETEIRELKKAQSTYSKNTQKLKSKYDSIIEHY